MKHIEAILEDLAILPGKNPVPVKDLTNKMNTLTDTYSFSSKGVGRYLKANGFQRTVRVINGTHAVCYCLNDNLPVMG